MEATDGPPSRRRRAGAPPSVALSYEQQHRKKDAPPLLTEYQTNRDGSLTGLVFGKAGMEDGARMTTSAVKSTNMSQDGESFAVTVSGSTYRLGDPATKRSSETRERRAPGDSFFGGGRGGWNLRNVEPSTEVAALLQEVSDLSIKNEWRPSCRRPLS